MVWRLLNASPSRTHKSDSGKKYQKQEAMFKPRSIITLSILALAASAGSSTTTNTAPSASSAPSRKTAATPAHQPVSKNVSAPAIGLSAPAAANTRINLDLAAEAIARDVSLGAFGRTSAHQLSASAADTVEGMNLSTARFRHTYNGLPVIGSQVLYHQDGAGRVWIESAAAEFDLATQPSVQVASAVAIVRSQLGRFEPQGQPSLEILPTRVEETEVQDSARLVYRVQGLGEREPIEAFVDAHSGELLSAVSRHITIAPISIYSAKGQGVDASEEELATVFDGDVDAYLAAHEKDCQILMDYSTPQMAAKDPLVINVQSCAKAYSSASGIDPSTLTDASARQAALNTQRVLEYFQARHGRDSFDGKGGEAISVVHAGVNFANAFWNSVDKIMAYGDGDGLIMGDLTQAVDVAGHEMTHGVVSETANLMYVNESGALNEAIADYFGKLIENRGTWLLGEGLFLDGTAGIRDMERPARLAYQDLAGTVKPYPDHYLKREKAKMCSAANDNCWVHINSTIFSHGLYRVHRVIGAELTQKLVYQTLTQELVETSTLVTAANSLRRACAKSFPASTCAAVDAELKAVGI